MVEFSPFTFLLKKLVQEKQEHHNERIGVDDLEIESKRDPPALGHQGPGGLPNQPKSSNEGWRSPRREDLRRFLRQRMDAIYRRGWDDLAFVASIPENVKLWGSPGKARGLP